SSGSYQIDVVNNGNGSLVGGQATGEVIVTDVLPAGMTLANAGAVGGTGWDCSVTLNPGAFTCVYDIAGTWPGGALPEGQLAPGESLPPITVGVEIGGVS